ncbi:hypothetical protein M409DRAFT_25728 [Zasmidium cellare ATCC 36951]|uniref:FAD-binding domain-containing protein n=1 Tax=Zasmidium cellare ATCC 36951 TaxID=1080233 RepID=A0A6A6CDE8_ZASCE|nr:uncharacterized protein M409DRAFT_25728 [Zasmidium cellare ATCC 36951]KAF2163952.1 hypothetical protein M409DRAFT_25728 [Zasmidium cellare ATCC 36951]
MPLTILIVGAGIGGFTAAVALRQAGHQVTVLEKHENKREVGFAVSLPPNSTRVLRSLGLDFKKVRASKFGGIAFAKAERSEYEILAQLQDDAEDQYGAPSLAAHRVDLHNALRELATGPGAGTPVNVLEGITVTAYSPSAGSVTLEDGRTMTADVIVAADGVKSTAHKHIIGEERPTTLSRLSNVRFCVPTETMLQNPLLKKTLPNGSDYPTLYRGTDPDVMLLRYPCRDHTLQNFGCYALTHSPSPTTAAAHWTTEPTLSILLHRLSGFDPTIREIAHLADPTDMYLWKVLDRDPLPAYHRGRMILLGDAAHAMQPTFGMGATFAVEDAGVLGVVLRDVHDRA